VGRKEKGDKEKETADARYVRFGITGVRDIRRGASSGGGTSEGGREKSMDEGERDARSLQRAPQSKWREAILSCGCGGCTKRRRGGEENSTLSSIM